MIIDYFHRPLKIGTQQLGYCEIGGVRQPRRSFSLFTQKMKPNELVVTNSPAGAVQPDKSYSYTPAVEGGVQPYTFELVGELSEGFVFDASTGALTRPPQ